MSEPTQKTKIAFIKFGGMCSGGTEKHLQTLAKHLANDKYDVTYFYCDAAPYIGSDFKHLDTDPHRLKYMENSNVKLVKFNVEAKDITHFTHPWVNTTLWEVFEESSFDIIQTGRAGHAEYPFTEITKTSIVDSLHLAGHCDIQENIKKVVLVGEDQKRKWAAHLAESLKRVAAVKPEVAGRVDSILAQEIAKTTVIPPAIEMPEVSGDLREELSISKETTIYGMHQRPDDGIFCEALLTSWYLSKTAKEDSHLIILGGSSLYEKHAEHIKQTWPDVYVPNVTFLPATGDVERVHKFLNTIDVFTHARKDGEQCSSAVIEALYHGLPIIAHYAPSMGHKDQIGDAGYLCDTYGDYADRIDELFDAQNRSLKSKKAREKYDNKFSLPAVINAYSEIYENIVKTGEE